MNKKFNEIQTESMARIIEENLYEYCIEIADSSGRGIHIDEDVSWTQILPTCWPNYIFKANFTKDNMEKRVQQVIDIIKKNQAPTHWVVGPDSSRLNLLEYLETCGFKRKYTFTCMAIDLLNMNAIEVSDRLKIETVSSRSQLDKWADVVSAGLFNGGRVEPELFEYMLESEKAELYIGIYDETPVATSMLYISSGIASISMVSTLPDSRKKGIGTSMVLKPLYDAKAMGYGIGVLQATRAGEPIYKKIGFKEYSILNILNIEL